MAWYKGQGRRASKASPAGMACDAGQLLMPRAGEVGSTAAGLFKVVALQDFLRRVQRA